MEVGDLFSFDKMIAPAIVKPLYWILLILIVLSVVWGIVTGFFWFANDYDFWQGMSVMFGSIIWIALAVPLLRIAAELTLVQFEVREKLKNAEAAPQQLS